MISPAIAIYKFKLEEEIFIRHKYNGNIYIVYDAANSFLNETLIASNIKMIFIYVRNICLTSIHADKHYDHLVFHVKKIEVCPELKCANIYCLED